MEKIFKKLTSTINNKSIFYNQILFVSYFTKLPFKLYYKSIKNLNQRQIMLSHRVESFEYVNNVNPSKMFSVYLDLIGRGWTHPADGSNEFGSSVPLTIMSYNILAQDLLEKHPEFYQNHAPCALEWPLRFKQILLEIDHIHPDVLCLQEVQVSHLIDIARELAERNLTKYIFKKRTDPNYTDGCAIFFNDSIFDLCETQTIEYFQPNVDLLNRHNVAIIVRLAPKSNPHSSVIIATTHLLYNPNRNDVRVAQIQMLLAELNRMSYIGRYQKNVHNRYPIILTGDFNSQRFTAPYNLIADAYLDYSQLTQRTMKPLYKLPASYPGDSPAKTIGRVFLPKSLAINDLCQHVWIKNKRNAQLFHSEQPPPDHKPPASVLNKNVFHSGNLRHNLHLCNIYEQFRNYISMNLNSQWTQVDYIFYSKTFNPTKDYRITDDKLKLVNFNLLPTCSNRNQIGSIPNAYIGSDHFSLAAKFLLKT